MENGANGISKKYIKRLKRALKKRLAYDEEIIRDVEEMFENSLKAGESAQDLISRLGTPEEFSAAFAPNKRFSSGIAAFAAAAVPPVLGLMCIVVYLVGKAKTAPSDAIGFAESATEIFVTGGVGTEAWLISGTVMVLISPILAWITRKIVAKRKKNG